MTPIERLREAVQEYVRAEYNERRVVTAFVVGVESIDMHTAADETFVNCAGSGGYATCVGLASILNDDIKISMRGDDA